MPKYIVARILPMLAAAVFVAASCGGDAELDSDTLLIGDTAAGQVAIGDDPGRGVSSGRAGGSSSGGTAGGGATGGGRVRTGTIASGTSIVLESGARVCTHTHKVGQTFTADVKNAITGSNGAVIPAGSDVTVLITLLRRRDNLGDRAEMGFAVKSIQVGDRHYDLSSDVTAIEVEQVRSPGNKDVQKVVGGAIVGAVVGQILGKDTKSTVIGAATGAAAGTIVAMAGGNYEGCVPQGGDITISLNSPLVIPL